MAKIKSKIKRTITIELSPREALALIRACEVHSNALAEDKDIVCNIFSTLPGEGTLENWVREARGREND